MKKIDFSSWKTYVHGFIAFIVSNVATVAVAGVSSWWDGQVINWLHLKIIMTFNAILFALAYVSKHPIPDDAGDPPDTLSTPRQSTPSSIITPESK